MLWFDSSRQLFAWSFDTAGGVLRAKSEPFAIGSPAGSTPALAVLPDGEIVLAQVENGNEVHVQR